VPTIDVLDLFQDHSAVINIQGIQHQPDFVGKGLFTLFFSLKGLGMRMRFMSKACRMKGSRCPFDIITTEKVPTVLKQHFVVIVVIMIKRQVQCPGITFYPLG
jgi:hypothetical protein